jgi:DNA-binding SARP family transcriptional activator
VEFPVLGPLEIREGDLTLALSGAKQRALLAVLLLHANEVVSRDRLLDELWGEEPPGTGADRAPGAGVAAARRASSMLPRRT